jgi:DNA-binding IscR family transcriptional regulator
MAKHLSPAAQLLDALRVLRAMTEGLRDGRVHTLPELSRSLRLAYDTLEEILDKLASAGMVGRTTGEGWLMRRDASHIRTAELLRLFVLDGAPLPDGNANDPLRLWVADTAGQFEQSADLSLQELFARNPA